MLKAILLAPLIPMLLVGLLFMAIGFTSSGTLNIGVPIMAMGIGSIIAYPFMIIWGIPVIIVLEKKLRNKKNTKLVLYTIAGIIDRQMKKGASHSDVEIYLNSPRR